MIPERPLPFNARFEDVETYTESLLNFITSNSIFQYLCGGVHILDFLTQDPDLYSSVLPLEWRQWFALHEVSSVLDLLLREDLSLLQSLRSDYECSGDSLPLWRGCPPPPLSLLNYVLAIRYHSLQRAFSIEEPQTCSPSLPHQLTLGMKPKKIHEISNFANFLNKLFLHIPQCAANRISHVVDFGSGQNYLGRTLASPPYGKAVIALESKEHNITGARTMDVNAKIVKKERHLRNKKLHRHPDDDESKDSSVGMTALPMREAQVKVPIRESRIGLSDPRNCTYGTVAYVKTVIERGDLSEVMKALKEAHLPNLRNVEAVVVSLHSCGNLVHHGLRSLIINPFIKAVCMVGCCYNLMTERLGLPTSKHPSLRTPNERLERTASACDPHGFPMSQRMAEYRHGSGAGIRFNITARMMACQAPENWTQQICDSFFTRHFYRALLQRVLLDHGLVGAPFTENAGRATGNPRTSNESGPAIMIGSLRKSCYVSFVAYVRGALAKMSEDPALQAIVAENMESLTDEDLRDYEAKYAARKKDLSILWSLMAFSASVVESAIVLDRWLFLHEQPEVSHCWVETVFDYGKSPRNLAVIGIKK